MITPHPIEISRTRRITQAYTLDSGDTLEFRADHAHVNGRGVEATVSLWWDDGRMVVSDAIAVERSRDRALLAATAWQRLGDDDRVAWGDQETLALHLDSFCVSIWPMTTGVHRVELVSPTEEDDEPLELLAPWIVKGGGHILYAPPGRGKTFLGLLLAVSIDAGLDTLWKVSQARTLYINLERSDKSLRRRLRMVNRALGLDPARPLLMLNARGWSMPDVQAGIVSAVEEYGVGLGILDSLSRAGADLNDNTTGNAAMDTLNRSLDTWLALGHTPRQDESHVFGSTMFDAAADVMVELKTSRKADGLLTGVGLQITKANDLPTGGDMQVYELRFDRERGLISAGRGLERDWPDLSAQKRRTRTEQIADAIEDAEDGVATATHIAEVTGIARPHVSGILNKDPQFVRVSGRGGREQFYGIRARGRE